MALGESMSKPVIAAISGTCLVGGFEFALSCDLRIAEDGDYLIDDKVCCVYERKVGQGEQTSRTTLIMNREPA